MSHTYTRADGTAIKNLSCAETAVLLRQALKEGFPGVKFSVRSRTYSGGASIDVSWTDGPLQSAVQKVCDRFEGADFDAMQDLKTYRAAVEIDGENVRFGADWIFQRREVSPEFQQSLVPEFERLYRRPYRPDDTYEERAETAFSSHAVGGEYPGSSLLYRLALHTEGPR